MKRRLIVLSLASLFLLTVFSCTKSEDEKMTLSVTEEEKKDNWKAFEEIGFKVHIPKELSNKKDNINVVMLGNEDDDNSPIYNGYLYQFVSDETNSNYDAIIDDANISENEKDEKIEHEILPKLKDMFTLATLRSTLITKEGQIEEILNAKNIEVLRKTDKYTQVIAFNDGSNVDMLTENEQKQYKEFLAVASNIKNGAKAADPKPKKLSLQNIKALKFKTQDLDGKEVTQEVLKNADVTMINIWATWCPPCKAELPDIGRVAKKYRAKGCQVIAICSDVTDEDTSSLEDAKEIIKDAECDFLVLRKNPSLNAIYSSIQAYPTTLFFDKNGDVVGTVIIGGRSESDFEKAFDEILEKIKK